MAGTANSLNSPSTPLYTARSRLLRVWPPAMLLAALVVLTLHESLGANVTAGAMVVVALASARLLPWRVDVLDEGLVLLFPFGLRRFLPRDSVTINIGPGGATVQSLEHRRIRYPITDGLIEHPRLPQLRAVLVEHGFHIT